MTPIIKTLQENNIIGDIDGITIIKFEDGKMSEREIWNIVNDNKNIQVEIINNEGMSYEDSCLHMSRFNAIRASGKNVRSVS